MKVEFSYDKGQVLQALRYHFLSKKEIRLMIILVNVFALASAAFLAGFAVLAAFPPEGRAGLDAFFVGIQFLPLFYNDDLQWVIINLYFSALVNF